MGVLAPLQGRQKGCVRPKHAGNEHCKERDVNARIDLTHVRVLQLAKLVGGILETSRQLAKKGHSIFPEVAGLA